jgi:hypothetical protein
MSKGPCTNTNWARCLRGAVRSGLGLVRSADLSKEANNTDFCFLVHDIYKWAIDLKDVKL